MSTLAVEAHPASYSMGGSGPLPGCEVARACSSPLNYI